MRMIKPTVLLGLLVVTAVAADGDTLYAGDYLTAGFGARGMALGGAYSALAADAAAPAYNPAGLAFAGNYGGLFMHSSRFAGLVNYDTLSGFWTPDEALGSFALSWIRTGYDDIKLTRWGEDGRPEVYDVVDSTSNAFQLTYARQLLENLSAGVTLRYLYDDLVPDTAEGGAVTADGIGFDLGVLWRPAERAGLALVIHDPYTVKTWSNGTADTFEPRLVIGGAWGVDLAGIDSVLTLSGDAELILADYGDAAQLDLGDVSLDLHGGVEITVADVFSARLGADRGKLTLGGGVSLWGISLDYCWLNHELGSTHRISIAVAF